MVEGKTVKTVPFHYGESFDYDVYPKLPAQLSREEMVPSSLKVFTLSFVVEGKTVKTVPFHYGESFDYDVYPKLPQKEGCYARWSDIDLQDLRFDTVVEATYYPFLTSLSSAQHRDGDQAIAFVQGKFQEGDALELTPGTTAFDGEVVEQWKISVPADGQQTHTIRYLPTQEDVQVYVLRSGSWSKVPFQQMGSYLAFSADGAEVEFAIVSADGGTGSWIWVVVSVVALGALIAGLVMRKKRQKSGKKSRWLLVVLVLLAVLVLVGVLGAWLCFPGTKVGQGMQAYDVIKTYMSQPSCWPCWCSLAYWGPGCASPVPRPDRACRPMTSSKPICPSPDTA